MEELESDLEVDSEDMEVGSEIKGEWGCTGYAANPKSQWLNTTTV